MRIQARVGNSGKPAVAARADKDDLAPPRRAPPALPAAPQGALHDYAKMARPSGGSTADAIVHAGGPPPNRTGLPDHLKAGVEHLSGLAMDDVRVHYNSPKPAQLQALAYAQGADIHVGPGQQRYLPHEAWHVVQQKQGRVKPRLQMKGNAINDDSALEREADHFSSRAHSAVTRRLQWPAAGIAGTMRRSVIQRKPFVTINDKTIDLGELSISELQALHQTTLDTGAMQAIEAQIRALQGAKEVGNNAGGKLPPAAAVVKSGPSADKKDAGDDKKDAGGGTTAGKQASQTSASAASFGSELTSITVMGTRLQFTEVSPLFKKKANLILQLLSQNWMIHEFLDRRPCVISLKVLEKSPAYVRDKDNQVEIDLATWYFERYDLGYIMGMLAHELGIHPMASKSKRVSSKEAQDAKSARPLDSSQQRDHLFGVQWDSERNKVYRKLVLEMAIQLAEAATQPKSGIPPGEATKLIDSFIMDCVSISTTDDHRERGLTSPGVLASAYNDYKKKLQDLVKSRESLSEEARVSNELLLKAFPGDKSLFNILANYGTLYWRFSQGKESTASVKGPSVAADAPDAATEEKSPPKAKSQGKPKSKSTGGSAGDIELIDLWKH